MEKIMWAVFGAVIATLAFMSIPATVFPIKEPAVFDERSNSSLPLICDNKNCISPGD